MITEDKEGFLWVGTQGGVARWDGYRFRAYRPILKDPASLRDGWISALHTDRRGRLWIGTNAGGLARYDPKGDAFIAYPAGPQGLSSVNVTAIADAGNDGLWVATNDGLDHLDPDTGRVVAYRHDPGDPGSLPTNRLLSLLMDHDGILWVGTHDGLVRRMPGSDRFDPVPLAAVPSSGLMVWSLFHDPSGQLWIGTRNHGAFVVTARDAAPRPVGETTESGYDISRDWIYAIGAGAPGEVWLGTSGHGIVAVDTASFQTRRISHQPAAQRSLANDTIWSLYQDRSGGVWVGTTGSLSRLESSRGVQSVSGISGANTLSEPDVDSILAAADGRIWAGLGSKGIDIFDPDRQRVHNIAPQRDRPETALPESYVLSIAQWSANRVYIGTGAGVYRADADGMDLARVDLPGRDPTARTHVLATIGDRLWIGDADDGLWSFTPGGPSLNVEHFGRDQLTDGRIVSLAKGLSGDLWIGTSNGLNRLDFASHTLERIAPQPDTPNALTTAYIPAFLLDKVGRLWVATEGGGIQVLVGGAAGHRIFRHIGMAQGLPNDNVSSLLADAVGRIWAITEGGVVVIDPESFAVQALSRADGVPPSTPWDHSAAITKTGELLFGTAGESGITVIRPDLFRTWTYQPPIVLTGVRVGGQEVPASRFDAANGGEDMVVQPDGNSLAVEFSALDYSAPEKNRYAYWLEGFDKTWIETDSTRRLAAYTNLPPGRYVLHLRGSNRNGAWSSHTLDASVRVLPAWYQTIWFRTVLALSGFALVTLTVRLWTVAIRRREHALEALVDRRTAELKESQRDLEKLAYYDTLTGLANRRMFSETMARLLASSTRHERPFALILIDLDWFKQINDTLGHDAGDALLVAAAAYFSAAVREIDTVARLGGDEFAILIRDTGDAGAAEAVCDRLIDLFATPIAFGSHEMSTSPSMGIALFPCHGETQAELYKAADTSLYVAKRTGRNTWRMAIAANDISENQSGNLVSHTNSG